MVCFSFSAVTWNAIKEWIYHAKILVAYKWKETNPACPWVSKKPSLSAFVHQGDFSESILELIWRGTHNSEK